VSKNSKILPMIKEIDCNLLMWFEQQEQKCGLIQQLNCFWVQNSGIAKLIRAKYPTVYDADVKSGKKGDSKRLGSFSVVEVLSNKFCIGLYGQYNYGAMARFTSYDAVDRGLRKIETYARENNISTLGLPKNMGCVRGGGDYRIVRAIIECVFADSPIELYICNYDRG
jgi:O-acetyl-ADP-ribose deacetylase (regulator of RNase III)